MNAKPWVKAVWIILSVSPCAPSTATRRTCRIGRLPSVLMDGETVEERVQEDPVRPGQGPEQPVTTIDSGRLLGLKDLRAAAVISDAEYHQQRAQDTVGI
ncbi:hypothetical protein [Streptomyces sp. PD-S100-1]|uniref:hypothetical protein n=1 Tax=Streptomyces sp. PD-S100-1 TaxID=3394351 RepID=UPI0039BD6F84